MIVVIFIGMCVTFGAVYIYAHRINSVNRTSTPNDGGLA